MHRSHHHLRALDRVLLGQNPLIRSCSSPATSHRFYARAFQSLGLHHDLVQRLAALGVTNPSPVQRQAIPAALRRQDVVIAAETGGGKTLAYLLPLLTQLRAEPLPLGRTHSPVALVLTTSQELVRQVAVVLSALDPELARHATVLSSSNQTLRRSRRRACPLVVATPHALLRACKPQDFAFTRTIVVDEADMLLSGGFEKDTKQILATIRNQPLLLAQLNECERTAVSETDVGVRDDNDRDDNEDDSDDTINRDDISGDSRQTIFMHATIPDYGKRSVRGFIAHKFPDAVFAVTEDFQRTLPRLDMRYRELEAVAGPAEGSVDSIDSLDTDLETVRNALVWEILTDTQQEPTNTLVFTNSVASADALFEFLDAQVQRQSSDSPLSFTGSVVFPARVLLFHKEVNRQQRQEVLAQLDDERAHVVVVCTDIAARGLDTTKVRHVVQYEFATDVVSHLHRIGRTGRAGTSGRVTNIVSRENALVLDKIRAAGASSLMGAFSRKRSLRKKAKKNVTYDRR